MKLPKDVEELIMDYYWSHKIFELKTEIHRDLKKFHMLHEMRIFYSVFNTITVELIHNPEHTILNEPNV